MKIRITTLSLLVFLLLSACGNSQESSVENKMVSDGMASPEMANDIDVSPDLGFDTQERLFSKTDFSEERMIVSETELSLSVNGIDKKVAVFQDNIKNIGGYLVESSVYEIGNGKKSARILARVPSDNFEEFLTFVESESEKVYERNVHGQDVTEEYIDPESRLKAKKVVEERLLSFMNNAEKTEDLLKISNDLGKIQEEIEQIEGKMKFLENRVSFSSVTLHIQDAEIVIPSITDKDLNTWQQAKKTFFNTINGLKLVVSEVLIVLIGFSPVWIPLAIIVLIIWLLRRHYNKTKMKE